jgi:hypothetical protein
MILNPNSQSQAGQESFVLNALSNKRKGFYLEVGAFDGKKLSNTKILESDFDWFGIGIEINLMRSLKYRIARKNRILNANALSLNYTELFKRFDFPNQVDYLQIDIEPAINSFHTLCLMPWKEYRFSVITFEHDLYVSDFNLNYKNWSESLLRRFGYIQVVSNLSLENNPFEDWWVDREVVSQEFIDKNRCNDVNWSELFN